MYWFAGTTTAQQIINTTKFPVLSKIVKKSMVINGLALIFYHYIRPFNMTMTVKNQTSGCFLKSKFNLEQNTKRLFQVLAKLPLTTTEMQLGYCCHRWSVRVASLAALTF